MLKARKSKLLAVLSPSRIKCIPDVPTAEEQGWAMGAPKKTRAAHGLDHRLLGGGGHRHGRVSPAYGFGWSASPLAGAMWVRPQCAPPVT